MPWGPHKATSFLLWTKITGLSKNHAERPSFVVYCKPSNKFLFPLKTINICAYVRDPGNAELHCPFLHRDVHFPHDNKVASPHSRRNFVWSLWEMKFQAMERFSSVTYQYASNRMNATYQWFMPKRGDLPIRRRGFMQRRPARGRMNCWFSLCLQFVSRLCLCLVCVRGLGCGLVFFVLWFGGFFGDIEEIWALKALALVLLHG